jgi:hypothetical protein
VAPEPTFNADDLLAALTVEHATDGMTSHELGLHLKRSPAWISTRLRQLHEQGRLIVGRAPRMDMAGVTRPQPVYQIRPATK